MRTEVYEKLRLGFVGAKEEIFSPDGTRFLVEQTNKGRPLGVVAAVKKNGKLELGWSLISPKEPEFKVECVPSQVMISGARDPQKNGVKQITVRRKKSGLDWDLGRNLALRRARGEEPNPKLPAGLKPSVDHFEARARKFFGIQ